VVGSAATSIRSRGTLRAIGVGSTLTPLLAGDHRSVQWCDQRLQVPNGSLATQLELLAVPPLRTPS